MLTIAHRLNTIQRSDIVYLMDKGSIPASGTFSKLLNTNETVKNLARLMSIDSHP
jgi:ABC-type multidrug transport system fused ATPase/permease subunit